MPTRKELLESLSDEIRDLTDAEQNSTDALEEHGRAQLEAADRMQQVAFALERSSEAHSVSLEQSSSNIRKGAGDIAEAIIVSAVLGFVGRIVGNIISVGAQAAGHVIKDYVSNVHEVNRKTAMIESILNLQRSYPFLTYRFIVERSYANDAGLRKRQTLLNGLVAEGIVTRYTYKRDKRKVEALRITQNNSRLHAYWDWLNEIRQQRIGPSSE